MLHTPFIFHPLHVTKTLVWQKKIQQSGISPTMGWYLPHSSGYVTLRGTSRTSTAIKALLSPVPPRHPWRRHISAWAGNLSSCSLAVTLKSTSYQHRKALWKARWCLPEQIICCHYTSLGGCWSITSVKVFRRCTYQAEHSFILLKEECGIHASSLSSELTPLSWSVGLNWGLISSSQIQSEWNLMSVSERVLIQTLSQLQILQMFFQTYIHIAKSGTTRAINLNVGKVVLGVSDWLGTC